MSFINIFFVYKRKDIIYMINLISFIFMLKIYGYVFKRQYKIQKLINKHNFIYSYE